MLSAIEDELKCQSESVAFTVVSKEKEGDIWKVRVAPPTATRGRHRRESLDETLEGQTAWWPGPPKGTADVLSVLPEELQINLRFAKVEPPQAGGSLHVFSPRYLKPLLAAWENPEWLGSIRETYAAIGANNRFNPAFVTDSAKAPCALRTAQRDAFSLTGWNAGYLWGPPGTGKTYTAGALVATYLLERPRSRVLLLSSTNAAVDEALLSVDTRLGHARGSGVVRLRVGNHYSGERYVGREHLLPVPKPQLVRRLAELEAAKPPQERVSEYAAWKHEIESVREELRAKAKGALEVARLSALTTTAATFLLQTLREVPPYDLIVFDEASQVGLAHALALAPLATRALYAGDPEQLLPIVAAPSDEAATWLGRSMFDGVHPDAMCFLDEQSRMAEPICAVVSGVFYDGRLKVAADKVRDREWNAFRERGGGKKWSPPHLWLESTLAAGTWSARYGGPIRFSSTEWLEANMERLLSGVDPSEILILTPFRAQRALIRSKLRALGYRGVSVSTIHRVQGGEKHAVVFDAVDGASPFFDETGRRLINVALSRAQARLVVLMSPEDEQNEVLRRVAEVIRMRVAVPASKRIPVKDVSDWMDEPMFPMCMEGKVVQVAGCVGTVVSATAHDIELRDSATGATRKFRTAALLEKHGRAPIDDTQYRIAKLNEHARAVEDASGIRRRREEMREITSEGYKAMGLLKAISAGSVEVDSTIWNSLNRYGRKDFAYAFVWCAEEQGQNGTLRIVDDATKEELATFCRMEGVVIPSSRR